MPAERFYLDSNVLISLLREEINGNFRSLFSESSAFFDYVRKYGAIVVVSDLFFSEVQKKLNMKKEDALGYFKSINIKTEQAEFTNQDFPEVRKFMAIGIHSSDAKHLAIALRLKCNAIVTFNRRDFEKAMAVIRIREPDEFIKFI
ncbi:MAG: PIN domain-containing protein [Candidatus Diapherotrites archaeon]|nr:PIN domain-containing protein [Candidatus Diapherotrites archaeon]